MAETVDALEEARQEVGLSIADLWFRYFALGGMSAPIEVDAILHRALIADSRTRDLLAVALNERYHELGRDHPIPYTDDDAIEAAEPPNLYRERISDIARDHQRLTNMRAEGGTSLDASQIEQAVALATDWAAVAQRHNIAGHDLGSAVDLAQVAFNTVMRAAERTT